MCFLPRDGVVRRSEGYRSREERLHGSWFVPESGNETPAVDRVVAMLLMVVVVMRRSTVARGRRFVFGFSPGVVFDSRGTGKISNFGREAKK